MTYGPTRSMNADLHIGATEGSFKKVIRDRGGFPEGTTYEARRPLDDTWYGIHEVQEKMSGDGVVLPTRDFVPTPPAHLS